MSRISLDSTLEMIAQLDGARSLDGLCGQLLQLTKVFGVEHILAGILPSQNATEIEQLEGLLLVDWPSEWLNHYFSKNYVAIDPTIKMVKTSLEPFYWSQLRCLCEKDPNADLVMNEAMDFKLIEGLTVPITTAEGMKCGFSFAGQHIDLTESTPGILSLLANYAFATSVKFGAVTSVAPPMAPRQMDVIEWAAEGKTDWEIGMILHVSEHTVDKYMRQVKEKLDATNRVQMIAKAIRLGLIK